MVGSVRKALVAAVLVALLASVGVAAATAKPRATTTLTMVMASTQQIPMNILVANFERVYPDIGVDVTYLPSSTIPQVLLPQLQAGNAPDLFYMQAGRAGVAATLPLAEAGRLLSLSNEVWEKRLSTFVKPAITSSGKLYAYPFALFLNAVVYNVDLFKQLGLKVPTTFAQVLTMCKKITAAGKIPFVQGVAEAQNGALFAQQRMLQYVYSKTPNWDQQRADKKVSFAASPEWRRTFQSIVDMKDAGCFPAGMQGTTAQQQFTTFARGDAVMTLMASTQFANVTSITPNMNAAWFNMPGDTAKQNEIIISGNMLGINATTKHATEAKTFIRFLSRPKQASLYAKVSGGNSYYDVLKGIVPPYMSNLAPLFKAKKVLWAPQSYWPNPSLNPVVLGTGVQGLFTGQKTVDDLLKSLDYLWDNPTATSGP